MDDINSIRVSVEFENGEKIIGELFLNEFTGKLVFDNNAGQQTVNEEKIRYVKFLRRENYGY